MVVPETSPISIRRALEGVEAVVAVSGELDAASRDTVERALRLSEDGRPGRLVIDLRGLTFMDTTGISCVLRARDRAARSARELRVLTTRGGQPTGVFALCGLNDLIEVVDPAR